jgi:hypothetical protein
MSFASLVELYQSDAEHRVREGTQGNSDSIIKKWLLPYFGELQVNEIDAVAIRYLSKHGHVRDQSSNREKVRRDVYPLDQ